mmetsp:Transcript_5536/g.9358  ORF Transcript_5536/g.9358 Transcript_5536/m.9358 type:complete len:352 (+) Transcript_5536:47-1102(+)
MVTMKKRANASPTTAAVTAILLLAARHTATAAGGGYQYAGFGSCRDINGNTYSNIQLTATTATSTDLACNDSCGIFLSSGTLRGFEWQLVDGFSRRCYCLFDAGSDVEAMALNMGGDGATWKGDNVGTGEIASAENIGIDSYCYKLVPLVSLDGVAPTPPPTFLSFDLPTFLPFDQPTQPPVDPPTQPPVDPPTFLPFDPPTQPPVNSPTQLPQSIEEIFAEIFGDESEQVFTTSQVDDDQYGYDQSAPSSNSLNPTPNASPTQNGSPSTALSTVHNIQGKSSKESTNSSKSSKSAQGSIDGKADKGSDDSSLMRMEQMRYKMGNDGRRRGGIDQLLLLVVTLITVSYLVW